MNWTDLIECSLGAAYKATGGLLDLVDEDALDWKPSNENNWMTMGQLLHHLTTTTGFCFRGFATGHWDIPEGEGMPPASAMPTVTSVAEAKRLLEEDRKTASAILRECGEARLANDLVPAPWHPVPQALGFRLLQMIAHLDQHKAQLFYYLKLQGKPVNTNNLWAM